MNAPLDPPTAPMALTPPTVEAAVWAESSLQAARDLSRTLKRLTIDHRRELLPFQADELVAARNHASALLGILGLLSHQLRQATAPVEETVGQTIRRVAPYGYAVTDLPAPPVLEEWTDTMLAPPITPDEAEEAEARADLEYDQTTNAF
jgi:hypothetical protein